MPEWRFNPSVHRAKGDMLVRARVLPACDNGPITDQGVVSSIPARLHHLANVKYEILSTVIRFPLIQEGLLPVTSEGSNEH